jgi:hypothetical protein
VTAPVLRPVESAAVGEVVAVYETLWPITRIVPLTASPPYEAIAWEFVVTRYEAIPVAAATMDAVNSSKQTAPAFYWNGTSWQSAGDGTCGGEMFAWGGIGPTVEFISACTS